MADPSSPSRTNDSSNPGTPEHHSDSNAKDASGQAKLFSSKDRQCPFCHQSFTSSSLGRHLDLFIRDKNPKAPDGVHDVERIRKLRSTITRRHARTSSAAGARNAKSPSSSYSNSGRAQATPSDFAEQQPAAPVQPPIQQSANALQKEPFRYPHLDWRATGVMNDLPPRSNGPLPSLARFDQQPSTYYPSHEQLDGEQARATELALKEVLRSVGAATARINEEPLFDFDFTQCDFPSLVLRVLSRPAALFSSTPLRSHDTWPDNAPGQTERDAMVEVITRRAESRSQPMNQYGETNSSQSINGTAAPDPKPLLEHMDATHSTWQALPDEQKSAVWLLELQRAYAAERDKREEAEHRLSRVQAEMDQLKAHLDWWKETVAREQRSYSMAPLSASGFKPPVLSPDEARALNAQGDGAVQWDYDKLVSKWKKTLQAPTSTYSPASFAQHTRDPSRLEHPSTAEPDPAQDATRSPFAPGGTTRRNERTAVPTDGELAKSPRPPGAVQDQELLDMRKTNESSPLPPPPQRRTSSRRISAQQQQQQQQPPPSKKRALELDSMDEDMQE